MRLFYEQSFESFAQQLYQQAVAEIGRYNVRTSPVNTQVEVIMQKNFNTAIPTLVDGGKSTLALEDDQGKEYEEDINANYNNHSVYATGNYTINYNGDSYFFNIQPTNFQEVGANASVGRRALSFKIRTGYVRLELTQEWKDFLRRNAVEVRERIQANLKGLEEDLQNLRPIFEAKVTAYIESRIKYFEDIEKMNNDINPF